MIECLPNIDGSAALELPPACVPRDASCLPSARDSGGPETGAVVCLHGWGCSVYTFRDLLPLLARAGRRAIAIDLPGHGLSDKPDGETLYTPDGMVTCIVEALDALGLERVTCVGHSMGGAIAALLAVRHPERVQALILCAPVGFGSAWQPRVAALGTPRLVARVLPYLVPRWAVVVLLRLVYGTLRAPTSRDYDEYWAPTQFPAFTRALRVLLHAFDWRIGERGGLAGIEVPTVVIYGSEDPLVTGRSARKYAGAVARTRVLVVPHGGHVIPEEAPDVVAAAALCPNAQDGATG